MEFKMSFKRQLSVLAVTAMLSSQVPVFALTQDALYYYKKGFNAEKSGQKTVAYNAYKEALALDPTDATTYLVMGQLLEGSQQGNEALSMYKAGLAHNPNDILLNAAVARLLEMNNMTAEAAPYQRVLAQSHFDFPYVFSVDAPAPNNPVVLSTLGGQQVTVNEIPGYTRSGYDTFMERPQVGALYDYIGGLYARTGRLDDAYNAYRQAVKVDPQGQKAVYNKMAAISRLQGNEAGVTRAHNNYRAYQVLDAQAQAQIMGQSIASLPETPANFDVIKSVSARIEGEPSAIFLNASPTTESPVTVTSTSVSGVRSSGGIKPIEVVRVSQEAVPGTAFLSAGRLEPLNPMANTLTTLPVSPAVRGVIPQTPSTTALYSNTSGQISAITRQPSESIPFEKVDRYWPGSYDSLRSYSLANPQDTGARLTKAMMDIDHSRIDDALVELNDVLAVEPNNVSALWLRARAHTAKGRYDFARADFASALALDPTNEGIRTDMVASYRRFGDWYAVDSLAASTPSMQGLTINAPVETVTSSVSGRVVSSVPSVSLQRPLASVSSVSARVLPDESGLAYPLLVPSALKMQSDSLNAASQAKMGGMGLAPTATVFSSLTPSNSYYTTSKTMTVNTQPVIRVSRPVKQKTYYILP